MKPGARKGETMSRERIDTLLTDRGYFDSRQKARGAIMAGRVLVEEKVVDKPGTMVSPEASIRITGQDQPYVSRGGLKLEKAVQVFGLDLRNLVVADLGASTGGFTDVCLQGGAARVYAVDVGYGQLAWSLRQDPRVVVLERTNARYLTGESLGETVDLVVTDVSFISLSRIFPAARQLLKPDGRMVALIKPQFEAGPDRVGKNGVVSDPAVHREVIREVIRQARQEGFFFLGLSYSPVTGPKGNVEYLLYLGSGPEDPGAPEPPVDPVVEEAGRLKRS